jgi:ferredoxin
MAAVQIRIDRDLCMGAGECVSTAPAVFVLDGDGKSAVLSFTDADEKAVRAAAHGCPNFAIRLVGDAD